MAHMIEACIGRKGRIVYRNHLGKVHARTVKLLRAYDSDAPHYPADRRRPVRMLEAEDHGRVGGSWGGLILLNIAVDDVESFNLDEGP